MSKVHARPLAVVVNNSYAAPDVPPARLLTPVKAVSKMSSFQLGADALDKLEKELDDALAALEDADDDDDYETGEHDTID